MGWTHLRGTGESYFSICPKLPTAWDVLHAGIFYHALGRRNRNYGQFALNILKTRDIHGTCENTHSKGEVGREGEREMNGRLEPRC